MMAAKAVGSAASAARVVLDTELAEKSLTKELPFDLVVQKQELGRIGNLSSERLTALRRLDVAFNNLTSLWGLEQLPNLRVFSAYCNCISDLQGLNGVTRLESLRLQQNEIVELASCFTSMRKLQELRLDHNKLSRLDTYLGGCSSLRKLDLSSNRLVTIDGLAGLQSLAELRLCNNSLRSLLPLRALPHLKELDVSYNKLSTLEGLQNLPVLETLHAEHNQLKTVQISQTYSRGNKALPRAEQTSSSSSSSFSGRKTPSSGQPPSAGIPATPDVVLGMAHLTDVFLGGNNLTSLEGLSTLGAAIEIFSVVDNKLSAADDAMNHFFACKKLRELFFAGNPIHQNDRSFIQELTNHLVVQCPAFKVFDDKTFARGAGRKGGSKVASFRTWEDASQVSGQDDSSTIATHEEINNGEEKGNDADEDKDDEDEVDDDDDDDGYDFNKHNAGPNAPTLSLKHMKTPEEIAAMEASFTSILATCKETLFNILVQPDLPVVTLPAKRQPAKMAEVDKKELLDKDDSIEQASSLFHHSSLETVAGFRDTVDHRGSLVKGSKLVSDDAMIAERNLKASPPKAAPFVFQIKSNVIHKSAAAGQQSPSSPDAPSSVVSSIASTNTNTNTNNKAKSPLTESRRLLAPSTDRPMLGSGLTRHGTKIKQKGGEVREVDELAEFLHQQQRQQSSKSLLTELPDDFSTLSILTSTQENIPLASSNASAHNRGPPSAVRDESHGVRTKEAAFLTAAPSDASLPRATQVVVAEAEAEAEDPYQGGDSFWIQHQFDEKQSDENGGEVQAGFSRFRSAAVSKGGARVGIDTRFLSKELPASHSARSLPDVDEQQAGDAHLQARDSSVEQIISTLQQRRFSEPVLGRGLVGIEEGTTGKQEFNDESDDDDDDDGRENIVAGLSIGSLSVASTSSRQALVPGKKQPAAVLKTFRTPNAMALSELEARLLKN